MMKNVVGMISAMMQQMQQVQPQQVVATGDTKTAEHLENFSSNGMLAEEWLRHLELTKNIGKWSEAQTQVVIMNKLTGAARLWHLNHGAQLEVYEEWKKNFLEAQSPKQKIGVLMDELQKCVQLRGEPIGIYARRKESIALQLKIKMMM